MSSVLSSVIDSSGPNKKEQRQVIKGDIKTVESDKNKRHSSHEKVLTEAELKL